MNLEPPDIHFLNAAEGWLGLGNTHEARFELSLISAASQSHPDTLEVRWQICAREKNWRGCADVGFALVKTRPDQVAGWIHRSYGLHELKQTRQALELLLPAARLFPKDHTVLYNLACYSCQLGERDSALSWLSRAFALGEAGAVKESALQDPDLAPLREAIAHL